VRGGVGQCPVRVRSAGYTAELDIHSGHIINTACDNVKFVEFVEFVKSVKFVKFVESVEFVSGQSLYF
jgi:hypothetical protein